MIFPVIKKTLKTKKHSSRMHTTCFESVRVSVATTRCCSLAGRGAGGGGGVGEGCWNTVVIPVMKKCEQVSSDHHQMSLSGKGLGSRA